ncbi:methyltransferase domain-containing protein [Oscillatoria amoena NRMC-F 0135]|nr:methyltransferase domain-containing protein [Oscillatoria amoena NRMC-F 0135]
MSRFSKRSEQLEIMDDLTCSGEVVHQTLRELEFINKWLGGNAITVNGIKKLKSLARSTSLEIADLGCGSGDMLKIISQVFSARGNTLKLTGFDANPDIVLYARKNCRALPTIQFETENILSARFQERTFDIIAATLFLHHFTSRELVGILRQLSKQTRTGIVINDLHRHPIAYYAITWLTRLFSKSSMVKYDAPLSVLRGFTRVEWIGILKEAGITNFSLTWRWAFRWQVIIYSNKS